MSNQEVIDEQLTAADPLADAASLPGPDSSFALGILQRAKTDATRKASKTRIAIGAAVAGLLGVTGVAVAYGSGDGRAGSSDSVVCNGTSHSDLVMNFDPRTDDPVRSCTEEWQEVFGVPAPDVLTACVDPGLQGSIEVYPGPDEVCAEHDSAVYAGPTDEQLRFAAFRSEALALEEAASPGSCVSFEETKAVLDALLAKHRLNGWTYGTPRDAVGPCAQVEGIVEHSKTIVVSLHQRR